MKVCGIHLWVLAALLVLKPQDSKAFLSPMSTNPSGSTQLDASSGVTTHAQLLVSQVGQLGKDGIHLILASQSPRRKEILEMMGLQGRFEVMHSPLDETALQEELTKSTQPRDYTRVLAEEKAKALASVIPGEHPTLVLGSDTIVDLDGHILEKPSDEADAKRMLRALSGVQHQVHTGVALYRVNEKGAVLAGSFTDTAKVTFAMLSDADIEAYVASGEPMDKAGSYGIQGIGGQLVQCVEGDFFTVSCFIVCFMLCRSFLPFLTRLSSPK